MQICKYFKTFRLIIMNEVISKNYDTLCKFKFIEFIKNKIKINQIQGFRIKIIKLKI